ncbi:MAG TPA: response regulator [Terriglobales bacterium]|jgi:CheY-like chemotaxis protein
MSYKPTILCVDDQAGNLRIRATMLEQFGCTAVTATDHRSALQLTSEMPVDLVVIDYHLARGESGEQIARDLRVMFPRLPLIMLTGDWKPPQSAVDSVDAVLIKGMSDPHALLDLIRKLLPEAGLRGPTAPSTSGDVVDNRRDKAS